MFVTLKNAHPDFKGNPFVINSETVVSIVEGPDTDGNTVTFIHGGHNGTWQVQEPLAEVVALLNK